MVHFMLTMHLLHWHLIVCHGVLGYFRPLHFHYKPSFTFNALDRLISCQFIGIGIRELRQLTVFV